MMLSAPLPNYPQIVISSYLNLNLIKKLTETANACKGKRHPSDEMNTYGEVFFYLPAIWSAVLVLLVCLFSIFEKVSA